MSAAAARPRVAVGTFEISGFVQTFADGLRRLGHEVTTAVRSPDPHFRAVEYDVDLSDDVRAVPWARFQARMLDPSARPPRRPHRGLSAVERLHWLIARHDVFVFVYGSIYPDRFCRPARMGLGREFALLKRLGKRIVCCFVGPEVRHASAFDQELRRSPRRLAKLSSAVPVWSRVSVNRPLWNLRRAELWADGILSQPNQAGLALRPYHHLFAPFALDRMRARIPGRARPLVLHSPSSRMIKGTGRILEALERLRKDGVAFDLRLVDGVQNDVVLAEMREADVVIDQLYFPLHGRLGVEAMASGCALATCNDQILEPFPKRRPIWHIDDGDLEAQLRRLLTDRPLRMKLANEGLGYVRKWHDHVEAARRILDCLEGTTQPDHHPEFFARHYQLPEATTLPPALRALGAEVARRHGLPTGIELRDLARRGLA